MIRDFSINFKILYICYIFKKYLNVKLSRLCGITLISWLIVKSPIFDILTEIMINEKFNMGHGIRLE